MCSITHNLHQLPKCQLIFLQFRFLVTFQFCKLLSFYFFRTMTMVDTVDVYEVNFFILSRTSPFDVTVPPPSE